MRRIFDYAVALICFIIIVAISSIDMGNLPPGTPTIAWIDIIKNLITFVIFGSLAAKSIFKYI